MIAPFKIFDNELAYVELYENYILSSIKEGILFEEDSLNWFIMIFDKYYPNKPFGYIADRIYPYTINPMMYQLTSMHERLDAMAIVSYSELGKQNALFEKGFFSKPLDVFSSVHEAKDWLFKTLDKNKKVDL